ncbi:ankyrin repeat domain 13 isoform 3-like protein [Camelus ferus]|nr:ankyrin repeat domain 13 isoform 3-like protein [Camelus ferus]
MVYTVLQHRDYHNTSMALEGVPELLRKILEAPDFYVQMKWEFTSWDNWAELMEVNHDDKVVTTEHFDLSQEMERLTLDLMKPKSREVERRLTSPVINTSLDTKNIAFERWLSKSVLQERRPQSSPADRNPLESLLGTVEHQFGAQGDLTTERATANNPTAITPDEYFNEEFDLKDRDIGRPKELTIRTQKFKATLWMCEDFPLSLVEQVIPIIDLMARTSAHFARLRDFIKLEFPPGFPVKIASPLTNFEVDQSVFEIPESYHVQDNGRNVHLQDEDYEIMQFAIQQSLLESSRSQELSGPASNGGIGQTYAYDAQYERAIQESLLTSSEGLCLDDSSETSRFDSDLQLAMELSARELEERELQLREEEAELQHVLQLSLTDNFLLNADDIKDELDYGRFTWLHAEH